MATRCEVCETTENLLTCGHDGGHEPRLDLCPRHYAEHVVDAHRRCPVCGWRLAPPGVLGCTVDDCSYRPSQHAADYLQVVERRKLLREVRRG